MLTVIYVLDGALLLISLYLLRQVFTGRGLTPRSLPPGPRGLPIIGNVADMPKKHEWKTFAEWGRKWGGICSVSLLGRPMIIINSVEIMDELDKRGAVFSNRPRLEMGGELVGYADTLVLVPYGPRFRTYRKHVSRYIGGTAQLEKLHPMIMHENRLFLKRILIDQLELQNHLRKLAGGIILGLTYGIKVQEQDDPFVELIEKANGNFNIATIPGNFLVDFFPILRKLPEWLPGMGFMETARRWAVDTDNMVEVPFAYTERQMASGNAPPSFVSDARDSAKTPEDLRDLKFIASSMYGGGADTTVSAGYAFFLAMILHPEVQQKAQAELDTIVGTDRLPTFADRPRLPYINAVVLETLRWNSVAPTGVPHVAQEDSFIRGYFVPEGSIITTNLWSMLHDPEIYPDPFKFDPERHIASPGKVTQRDPRTICFGYGRRVCPGMYLAEASMFCTISNVLAVFNISEAVENGIAITPVHENTSGTISHPEPFEYMIEPRSQKALSIVSDDHY